MIKHDYKNKFTEISLQEEIWNRIFRSHFTFRDKTQQNKLLASSQQVAFLEKQHFQLYQLLFTKRERLSRRKTAYNRHVLEEKRIKTFKIIKRLFLFIIVCYFKSLNTIQSFREVKKRDQLTLRDFHHIFQNVIAARKKDFELDSDYNSFSFKLFSSVISDQFFRKSTFDSFNDIDLFDLEICSSSSLKSFNKLLDKHVSFKQLI
jgi:hypothetical protein